MLIQLFKYAFLTLVVLSFLGCDEDIRLQFLNDLSLETSCVKPFDIDYYALTPIGNLSKSEKTDLIISKTLLIPKQVEKGACPNAERDISLYELLQPISGQKVRAHISFSSASYNANKATESRLVSRTKQLINSNQCKYAYQYLSEFVMAGSSEASGVMSAAVDNYLFTEPSVSLNHINVKIDKEEGLNGAEMSLSLALHSFPVGPNTLLIFDNFIRDRNNRYMGIQIAKRESNLIGCDFNMPTSSCRNIVVDQGYIMPISNFYKHFATITKNSSITCVKRGV